MMYSMYTIPGYIQSAYNILYTLEEKKKEKTMKKKKIMKKKKVIQYTLSLKRTEETLPRQHNHLNHHESILNICKRQETCHSSLFYGSTSRFYGSKHIVRLNFIINDFIRYVEMLFKYEVT